MAGLLHGVEPAGAAVGYHVQDRGRAGTREQIVLQVAPLVRGQPDAADFYRQFFKIRVVIRSDSAFRFGHVSLLNP